METWICLEIVWIKIVFGLAKINMKMIQFVMHANSLTNKKSFNLINTFLTLDPLIITYGFV